MSIVTLNLSRKWRSQDFNQIVGQALSVRILKNSLYLGHYFPVYLFSGQRGCGKTSTARIFAAAINCKTLTSFQKDPKKFSIPCLQCDSCEAMREGNHPDFIEIDAASHTGVDNIRSIIESSSLLPILGFKRVYLIDEAHMLSKAAFNAALKILEEPPSTALFILATTNPHKIIDTVRSRCFQLFFSPIAHKELQHHLQFICHNEKIMYTDDGLDLIVKHTEGSARDAINLLEQVRFSSSVVNKQAVITLLQYIDDQHILNLIQHTIQGQQESLIALLHSLHIDKHKAEFIWQRMIILVRNLLWIKYGIKPHEAFSSIKILEDFAKICSIKSLRIIMQALYTQEELFLKTSMPHIFLEMFFIALCQKKEDSNDNNNNQSIIQPLDRIEDIPHSEPDNSFSVIHEELSDIQKWQKFINEIEKLNEPLVCSVFKKSVFIGYNQNTHCVSVNLSKDFSLFKEWLDNSQKLWQPLLQNIFSINASLDLQFSTSIESPVTKKTATIERKPAEKDSLPLAKEYSHKPINRYTPVKNNTRAAPKREPSIDISNADIWKKTALLLRYFPGTVTEIPKNL